MSGDKCSKGSCWMLPPTSMTAGFKEVDFGSKLSIPVEPDVPCGRPDTRSTCRLGGDGSEEEGHGQEEVGGLGEETDWCVGGVRPEEAEDGQGQEGMGGPDSSEVVCSKQ